MVARKHRTLRVEGMTCEGCERTIERRLGELPGVQEVHADHRKGIVDIAYDLEQLTLREVERKVEDLGYRPGDGFWSKAKRGWLHYTEDNERGNLKAKPSPCCSHALEEIQRKKRERTRISK